MSFLIPVIQESTYFKNIDIFPIPGDPTNPVTLMTTMSSLIPVIQESSYIEDNDVFPNPGDPRIQLHWRQRCLS